MNAMDYGVKVNIDLWTGEGLEGWLLGETTRGLYLSLDPDGKVVRLLPRGTWSRIGYERDAAKARFVKPDHEEQAKKIETLAEQLEKPVGAAMDRVDHNRTKRLAATIHDTKLRLEDYQSHYRMSLRPTYMSQLPAFEQFVTARNAHAEILDEVRRSGLEDVLREYETPLRQVLSHDTIPEIDSQVVSLEELDQIILAARERDLLSDSDFGRQWVNQPITINIQVGGTTPEPPPVPKLFEQEPDHARTVAGWLKVLGGGALVVTNIGTGVVAGIVTGLPTLGWGMVPIALGIASSTQAGLNAAADALRDIHTPPKQ